MLDLEPFKLLPDLQLLHIVAFELHDYVPEAREQIAGLLLERGFSQNSIAEWRALRLRRPSAEILCQSCKEEVVINAQELALGYFTCPGCSVQQAVPYEELRALIMPLPKSEE